MSGTFEKNIFINCPFDNDFEILLRPLMFTIVYLGYNPRIALEDSDVSVSRLSKILKLINESKYSIHDLSRIKSNKKNEFARLNMPFELGIDFGSKEFSKKHKDKKFLVISNEYHDYKKALSDFAGFDAHNHKNEPIELIGIIRNWIYEFSDLPNNLESIEIWYKFEDFMLFLRKKKINAGYKEIKDLQNIFPIKEFIQTINEWKIINP